MAASDIQQTIQNLEDQTWKALSTSGEQLLPFLAPDCVFLFPLGMKISHTTSPDLKTIMTSEAFIPWKSYDLQDVEVIPVGQDAAVITYNAVASRPGDEGRDEPFRALISSTWRKDGQTGRYLMCVHQQTPYTEDQQI